MYWVVGIISISLLGIIGMGVYFDMRPLSQKQNPTRCLRGMVGLNLLAFVAAEIALLFLAAGEVMAQPVVPAGGTAEVSVGMGLALIGIGIPTALATIGAGIAVGPVGASSLAIIAEKPDMFGRTLIYLGLSEGIAIYGLVVTILLLGKIA
jgi:V/A-type H+-transporting ATPase subunit K